VISRQINRIAGVCLVVLVMSSAAVAGYRVIVGPQADAHVASQVADVETSAVSTVTEADQANTPLSVLMAGSAVGRRGGNTGARVPTSIFVP
jgi:hypothetical protein